MVERASDAQGWPLEDPTANVIAILEAATKRTDDLREAAVKRQDDMRSSDYAHITDLMNLTAAYEEKLRLAEAHRIDAIRAVDVGNVQRAAEVQQNQAAILATTVTASAEAMRTQVAAAAAASVAQTVDARQSQGLVVAVIGLAVTVIVGIAIVIGVVLSQGGSP